MKEPVRVMIFAAALLGIFLAFALVSYCLLQHIRGVVLSLCPVRWKGRGCRVILYKFPFEFANQVSHKL